MFDITKELQVNSPPFFDVWNPHFLGCSFWNFLLQFAYCFTRLCMTTNGVRFFLNIV